MYNVITCWTYDTFSVSCLWDPTPQLSLQYICNSKRSLLKLIIITALSVTFKMNRSFFFGEGEQKNKSLMEDIPVLSMEWSRSINIYCYISPYIMYVRMCVYACMRSCIIVYRQMLKRYKDRRFSLPIFTQNVSKDSDQHFAALFVLYAMCIYHESARIK